MTLTGCSKNGDLTNLPGVKKPIEDTNTGIAQLMWAESNLMMAHSSLNQEYFVNATLTNKGTSKSSAINLNWVNSEISIWIDQTEDHCSGKSLSPNSQCVVKFIYKPTHEGIKNRTIQAVGEIGNSLTIWGSTNPENPAVVQFSLNITEHDFHDVLVGSQTAITITVSNTGGVELINGEITVNNSDFSIANNQCLPTLALNASCSFQVSFNPQTAKNYSSIIAVKFSGQTKNLLVMGKALTPTAGLPTANSYTGTTNEDAILNGQLSGFDPAGLSLTYSLVSPPSHGTIVINSNGDFVYTPTSNYFGSDVAVFKVTNTNSDISNLASISITVNSINDAPVTDSQSINTNKNQAINLTLESSDVEGSNLTYTLVSNPLHGTITGTAPNLTYTPNSNYTGADNFTFKVNDGVSDSNTSVVSISVTYTEYNPETTNLNFILNEEQLLSDLLYGEDDNSDAITYHIVAQPSHGQVVVDSNTGSFAYAPNNNYSGNDFFAYRVFDGQGYSNVSIVTLNVLDINDAPVADIQSITIVEDNSQVINLEGTDIENDTLTYSIVSAPNKGVLSGTAPNLTYTPNTNQTGADSFTFKVNDGQLDSNTATVTISITAVNDAPITNNTAFSLNEDTVLTDSLLFQDGDSGSGTYTVVNLPTHGVINLNSTTGSFTYTPNNNYNGSDSFTFKFNDGQFDSNISTVNLTILPVNDLPVVADQNLLTNEDTALSITLSGNDIDSNPLTYTIISSPNNGVITGSGTNITYTPNSNYNGTDSFTYKANDGTGDSNGSTVSITITSVNDNPVANNQSVSLNEDNSLNGQLTGSDAEGSPLTFTLATGAMKGLVVVNTDGSFSYQPQTDEFGSDSFTFVVSDGVLTSTTGTVSITINPANDSPVASNGSYSTEQNTSTNINLNAQDPDGDSLTYTIIQNPSKGVLSGTAPNLIYTPNNGETGSDSITFKVNDGISDSNTATISVNILNNGNWHLVGWNKRIKLHLNNSNQGSLSNLPVLVRLNSSRINYSHFNPQATDLRLVSSEGNNLSYEIEKWNTSGESLVWVKVPSISANSTADYIWLYYNNTAALNDSQDSVSVWSNSYISTHHFSAAGGNEPDSRGNLDLTAQGTIGDNSVSQIGQGLRFTSSTSYLYHPDDALLSLNDVTLEAWIYEETRGSNSVIVSKSGQYSLLSNSGKIKFEAAGVTTEVDAGSEIALNTWTYVVATFDTTLNQCKIYINGVVKKTATCGSNLSSNSSSILIASNSGSNGFKGSIDEVRISSVARTTDWVQAQKMSMTDSLVIFGSVQGYGQPMIKSQLLVIQSNQDDGEITESGSRLFNNSIINQGNDYGCILVICADYNNWGYYRLQLNSAIPQGASILNARFKLFGEGGNNWSNNDNALKIYLQNTNNAPVINNSNICPGCSSNISVVAQNINWVTGVGLTWLNQQWNTSPNLSLMFDSLVNNSAGLDSGNYIQLWVSRSANYGINKIEASAQDYSHDNFNQAQLLLEWQE